jgi:hypothetical protein
MISKALKRRFDQYEKQEMEFCPGMCRAEDLECKFGSASWYRFYRWPDVRQIISVSVWGNQIAQAAESIRYHDGVTESEAELIAAASAYWLMQDRRRLNFLESQKSIHG